MKVQIVKRNEDFFVRKRGLLGLYKYMAKGLLWWSTEIYPSESYYGFATLDAAKKALNRYVESEKSFKEYRKKEKTQRRLRRSPMTVVEEIEIDI